MKIMFKGRNVNGSHKKKDLVPHTTDGYEHYTEICSGYPLEIENEKLCNKHDSYLNELQGNTWQDSDGKNLCPNDWYYDEESLSYICNTGFYLDTTKKYYFSSNLPNWRFIIEFYNDSNTYLDIVYPPGYGISINMNTEKITSKYSRVYCKLRTYSNQSYLPDTIIKVQIEEGTAATEYEPYHKADLSDIRSVGELQENGYYEVELNITSCPVNFGGDK